MCGTNRYRYQVLRHIDADPCHFDGDPDPIFYFDGDADPNPFSHFCTDLELPRLQNDPLRLSPFHFDADPGFFSQ
jgi:hypothetical protein